MVWVVLRSDALANGPEGVIRYFATEKDAKTYARTELQRENSVSVWEEIGSVQGTAIDPGHVKEWAYAALRSSPR
jgi:mannose/cellobiose epimerase-like protein (N-acyl-D-glucosamine 2-epimerase family)